MLRHNNHIHCMSGNIGKARLILTGRACTLLGAALQCRVVKSLEAVCEIEQVTERKKRVQCVKTSPLPKAIQYFKNRKKY